MAACVMGVCDGVHGGVAGVHGGVGGVGGVHGGVGGWRGGVTELSRGRAGPDLMKASVSRHSGSFAAPRGVPVPIEEYSPGFVGSGLLSEVVCIMRGVLF
jgi:hypothetical protein